VSGVVDSGKKSGHGNIDANDPLLTSLAAAFKAAFESKRIWADARSVIFHFRPIIVAAVCWLS
jgi:hypothetical protein